MKAKCPHCFGEKPDCKHCSGTGFVEAVFAEGILWTRDCQNPECGRNLAGSIRKPGQTPGTRDKEFENPPSCLSCGGETKWTNRGNASDALGE